nr:hypothetical protein [Tanacetum cinerariifolium]
MAGGLEGFDSECVELHLNTTSIFMTNHADAFDSDYDDAPTTCAILMARLSPAGLVNRDAAAPSYDTIILSELVDKQIPMSELQNLVAKLKGKSVDTNFLKQDLTKLVTPYLSISTEVKRSTKVFALGLFMIDFEPINSYFRNNKLVHIDYLNFTKEHTTTLQELLEQARALRPSNENIDYACEFAKQIQELL